MNPALGDAEQPLPGHRQAKQFTLARSLRTYAGKTNQPISQSANRQISKSTNQPISKSTNQPISKSTNQPINQSANRKITTLP